MLSAMKSSRYMPRLVLDAYLTLCKMNCGEGKPETEKVAQKAVAGSRLGNTR